MPKAHGRKMRQDRIFVSAGVHDGQLAVFVEMLESGHGRMKTKVRVDLSHVLGRNTNGRTLLVIGIVTIRNDGIHPVVPT